MAGLHATRGSLVCRETESGAAVDGLCGECSVKDGRVTNGKTHCLVARML